MLSSLTEADGAVQDTWLRLSRSGASEVQNLGGWLKTIVAQVRLKMLRSHNLRREESIGVHLPDPSSVEEFQHAEEALLASSTVVTRVCRRICGVRWYRFGRTRVIGCLFLLLCAAVEVGIRSDKGDERDEQIGYDIRQGHQRENR